MTMGPYIFEEQAVREDEIVCYNKIMKLIIISVIVALVIIAAAWWLNGSEYEDAWLYITAVWIIVLPLYELIFKKKDKDK